MTLLADYDLDRPTPVIWGVEGHRDAMVLVCWRGRPLDLLWLEIDPWTGALTRPMIERAMARQSSVPLHARSFDPPPEPHQPPMTVAVCTRDRPWSLKRCLEALARLDYPDYEVVVVDNAPQDDATLQVVRSAGPRCRYVCEPTPGLDWARNRAVAEAQHDLIAFCDDDAQASNRWLAALAAAFADPTVDAVTGLVLPMELRTRAQWLFEQYGQGMSKGLRPRRFDGRIMSDHAKLKAQDIGVGANMAVRRRAFDAIGGFDTALDVGTPSQGGGDLDFFHRLLVAGCTILYEPAAWMRHQHRRDLGALRQQLYANGRAYGVYLLKAARSGTVAREQVRRFMFGWLKWQLGRSVRAIFRKPALPRTCVWAELWGAMHAQRAYVQTLAEDQRRRAAHVAPSSAYPTPQSN